MSEGNSTMIIVVIMIAGCGAMFCSAAAGLGYWYTQDPTLGGLLDPAPGEDPQAGLDLAVSTETCPTAPLTRSSNSKLVNGQTFYVYHLPNFPSAEGKTMVAKVIATMTNRKLGVWSLKTVDAPIRRVFVSRGGTFNFVETSTMQTSLGPGVGNQNVQAVLKCDDSVYALYNARNAFPLPSGYSAPKPAYVVFGKPPGLLAAA